VTSSLSQPELICDRQVPLPPDWRAKSAWRSWEAPAEARALTARRLATVNWEETIVLVSCVDVWREMK
jgi:hypothetical protein